VTVVLSEYLPLLATAPEGIQKLRGLILELAVRGKLVPQDPDDDLASELLKRIAQERARLEAEGTCKKSKPLSSIGGETLYPLPNNWRWSALDPLVRVMDSGWSPACMETASPRDEVWGVLKTTAVQSFQFLEFENKELPSHLTPRPECEVASGDILITRAGPKNRVAISCLVEATRPRLMISDKIIRFHLVDGGMYEKFVALCLNAGATAAYLETSKSGMAASQMNITQEKLRMAPIPICSTAEQRRIVAKVDELMLLCDRLEAEQVDAEATHAKLVDTLLGTLTQSTDAADLATNWRRLAEHFATLFTTQSSLDALKQTILQLAVMGKLVPQDPNDEPASALLQRIAQERGRYEANGISRKSKSIAPLAVVEPPCAIPDGWIWSTIESIANVGTGTTPSRTNPAYFNPPTIPWVTSGETGCPFIAQTAEKVSELALEETNLRLYPPGTLIVAMYGQGKTRGQISELQIEAATNQACAAIAPILPAVELRKYIKLFFEKIYDEIRDEAAGGAQPNLNVGKIKSTLISLPPLAEQQRIVVRVDELMALCNRLKADLQESRNRQEKLAATFIKTALEAA
jgi:type I restriction enzyme S subunit